MSEPAPGSVLRFLFDQHVNGRAMRELRARGIDIVHVAEMGLERAEDFEILQRAQAEGRILVTRNYRDFAPFVSALARKRSPFPGVLFFPASIRLGDVGGHIRALERWLAEAAATGHNPVQNTYAWLR